MIPAFDWERDYGPLYRACPDAFWLAPDADDLLPTPDRAAPQWTLVTRFEDIDPPSVHHGKTAATMACLTAGPIFLAFTMFAEVAGRSGMVAGLGVAAISLFLAPFTMAIGAFLAAIPVTFGTLILGELGLTRAPWRRPLLWTAVGTAIGIVIAAMFANESLVAATALIFTSAASARIARSVIRWEGAEPA
ncbi:hypothetical protein M9980_06335 [Sphingomonas donggukensis]|uniref:Uncharacterized protein n=1 Tax=Sphingomonas donggukensis TaxID=2949093 RepID=A0ABY4TWN3_9SPHN|nr:hypothetical protein [Sphingomonas donggukensis]URW76808.1 hypothetical protein M9980_06335 [Sphingomonas donggukensis]